MLKMLHQPDHLSGNMELNTEARKEKSVGDAIFALGRYAHSLHFCISAKSLPKSLTHQ